MENKLGKLILDFGYGQVDTDLTPEQVEEKINKKVFAMLDIDQTTIKSELDLAKALRGKEALLYAIIEDVISEGALKHLQDYSFFNRFVEMRNLSEGDENVFYVEGFNKLVVARTAGNGAEVQKQRLDNGKEFSLELTNYAVGVIESLKRILLGRASWATLAGKLEEAVKEHIETKIYETFQKTMSSLPTAYRYTGTYDEKQISSVIELVEAGAGVAPVLVGNKSALRRLKDIDWASNEMKDARNSKGYIPNYLGYDCMPIDQQLKAGTIDKTLFANDEIYVIATPNKFIKAIVREGMIGNGEEKLHQNQSLAMEYNFELGVAVLAVSGAGLIKLT